MQMTADIPGRPDFFDHKAARDPEPGTPRLAGRPRLLAVVQRTHVEIRRISGEFMELAARAENRIREEPGMRIEGRDLAAALCVTVQRLDLCLRGHPRVTKEYARSDRRDDDGRGTPLRRVFYCLA